MMYDIRNVKNITDLIAYFSQNLGWNVALEDFEDIEDISYDFDAADIGLKEESFAKISSLRQLQPLVEGQEWGIFCVEFDSNRFEPSALKKILSGLIPRKRNSADHAVWCQQDLLFICNWGIENNKTIGIAHFEDKESGLPQIKLISCAPENEDRTQIKVFEERLSKLVWPKDCSNIDEWRKAWSSAFTTTYKQNIKDSSALTIQLAAEAQNIRNIILDILKVESKNGYVHLLYEKFRNTLINDMTVESFADMYAQTVVYGLFSARCMDKTQEDFSAEEAIECIPGTNPFLKSLMHECLCSNKGNGLSFDELEIGNVVDLLLHTKTDEIIRDFNRQTGDGREDPVIHFYEEFLTAYDSEKRVQRGVYYTPQPVVNYIVKAVDDIIKLEFGYEDGLASTDRKKIKINRKSKKKINGTFPLVECEEEVPAIQILDPATGTGTFIRQIILQVYDNFKNNKGDVSGQELSELWTEYVDNSLFPRINAFELMMAPYAVAHMKLAMVLKDTGYKFNEDSRLKVFLTNTLEQPGDIEEQISFFNDPLSMESIFANQAKKNKGINIVIGNPPYAVSSANKGQWIEELLTIYKTEPGGKEKLKEQKHSIDSDETKFIRYGHSLIENNEKGIIGYINPHGYLDKPTFRGMRWQLLNTFDQIYVINLHGNSNHQEETPQGGKDENVFDIQQGVCINIFVKTGKKKDGLAKVYYSDLFGTRTDKYSRLNKLSIMNTPFEEILPSAPHYLFVPANESDEYYSGFSLEELFTKHLEGIQTGKDKLVLQDSESDLENMIEEMISSEPEALREKYDLGKDGRDWTIANAQNDIKKHYPDNGSKFEVFVRPFDKKWSFYTGKSSGFIKCCRNKVSAEIINHKNMALVLTRNAMPQKPYSNFMVVDKCVVGRYIGDFSTSSQVFPLFSFVNEFGENKQYANLKAEIIIRINSSVGLQYVDKQELDKEKEYNAESLFAYVYAVLSSQKYRTNNKEFLCRDFPIIPYPTDKSLFWEYEKLGRDLVKAQVDYNKNAIEIEFIGIGDNNIKAIKRKDNRVYINKNQYFDGINDNVWEYWIGGHQIAQKWIKERRGKTVDNDFIEEYSMIIGTIKKSILIIEKIDALTKD